jgi:hypothetical protein
MRTRPVGAENASRLPVSIDDICANWQKVNLPGTPFSEHLHQRTHLPRSALSSQNHIGKPLLRRDVARVHGLHHLAELPSYRGFRSFASTLIPLQTARQSDPRAAIEENSEIKQVSDTRCSQQPKAVHQNDRLRSYIFAAPNAAVRPKILTRDSRRSSLRQLLQRKPHRWPVNRSGVIEVEPIARRHGKVRTIAVKIIQT